jgi:hypothetical protein
VAEFKHIEVMDEIPGRVRAENGFYDEVITEFTTSGAKVAKINIADERISGMKWVSIVEGFRRVLRRRNLDDQFRMQTRNTGYENADIYIARKEE